MRRLIVAACAASLLTLTACAAEAPAPESGNTPAAETAPENIAAPAADAAADMPADAELETVRISITGMG